MSTITPGRTAAEKMRRTAEAEPVALAGAVRALLYALLGTQLDARTLTEVVVVAETLVGMLVRQFVTPTRRSGGPRLGDSGDSEDGGGAASAVDSLSAPATITSVAA